MKKIFSVFLSLLLCFSGSTVIYATDVILNDDQIIISASISSSQESNYRSSSSVLSYRTDIEGNVYGPEDYIIDGINTYILNSANNTILKYVSGNLAEVIDLTELNIIGIKIAVSNDDIYVLGNDLIAYNISLGSNCTINLYTFGIDEAITDFKIYDNCLYVGVADRMGGSTYVFDISVNSYRTQPEKYHGYFLDQNTLTTVGYINENETSVGDALKIDICNLTTKAKETVYVETEYLLAGVQYLGKDDVGNHIIKTTELASNSDFTLTASETIRGVDSYGQTLYIRQIPDQVKNVVNQFKVINGNIYHLDCLPTTLNVISVGNSNYIDYDSYVSPLKSITPPVVSQISLNNTLDHNNTLAVNSITRAEIMEIAASYHSEFEWECTNANIAPMDNYTKPRCISTAGSYTMMPYCWGGFHTQTQFTDGLEAGGRAGNIATPSTGLVSNTYGLDCSGYVSRCWAQTSKYGTSTITAITTSITVSDLLEGDAFLKSGHIMLYEDTDGTNYILYEATQLNSYDRVAHTARSITNVTNDGYSPVRYINVD